MEAVSICEDGYCGQQCNAAATAGDVVGGRVDDLELALPPVGALSCGGSVLGPWARMGGEHSRLASFIPRVQACWWPAHAAASVWPVRTASSGSVDGSQKRRTGLTNESR